MSIGDSEICYPHSAHLSYFAQFFFLPRKVEKMSADLLGL